MSWDIQKLLRDPNGNFVPQFFNPANDAYEVILGARPWRLDAVTIPSGAAEPASGLDLRGFTPVKVYVPHVWTEAGLFFKESVTLDGTYSAVKNDAGLYPEIAAATVSIDTAIALDLLLPWLLGASYLKICSGTVASPVNQAADRTIYVLSM